MASTGPPTWSWPPIDASRPSLGSSSLSLSTFFLHDPIRRFTVARRLPRSSPRDPPPSVEYQKIDVELEFLSPEVVEKGWRQSMGATPVAKETEIFAPLSRRQRARLRLNSIQRQPLWKRIVFASKKAHGDSQTRSAGMELGFWVSLGYLTQALGLLTSEAGRASFISAFTIIVVPFIDGIFGATVPAMTWSGALLSLVGVAMIEYGGSPCVGDILNLLSAVFFGIHILRTEQISRSTKKTKFLALLGYEIFVVALSSAIWFIFQKYFIDGEGVSLGSCTWSYLWDSIISFPWIPAMYTGIFSTGLCLLVEMNAMCDVSATETAIIYGLEPVWGAAFAWFCLGERWGTSAWIGAFLVTCGSLAVQILGENGKSGSNMERSNEQKDFSLSTVAVNPRKNDSHLFRKRDKL
ncbi:hypothetical protein M5K25_018102 [Dendrobium thyrsiflorum]|uniref:EamA domain-containing protein n=1 Tax=Dendrobium thyrsiflorum TaxID=117978 RepID=A0ABD0UH22_DENTH